MQRYLAFFSYIGTRFRGAQAQLPPDPGPREPGSTRLGDFDDRSTVQGLFNIALRRFRPVNTPLLTLSSRTDARVHALCSSGHFDLLHPRHEDGAVFYPEFIIRGLNRYFDKAHAEISVHRLLLVPETFHSRFEAIGREYLYRLGVVRPEVWAAGRARNAIRSLTPISEHQRCWIVGGPFCTDRLRQCAALLSGYHDFRSFMGSQKCAPADLLTRRQLQIEVSPGATAVHTPDIQFWDISFRSQGFLYRQVRRMVGVMVAAARGRMTPDDVRHLLNNPDKSSWNPLAATAPPHGLYLRHVNYDLDQLAAADGPRPATGIGEDESNSPLATRIGEDGRNSLLRMATGQDGQNSPLAMETGQDGQSPALATVTSEDGNSAELVTRTTLVNPECNNVTVQNRGVEPGYAGGHVSGSVDSGLNSCVHGDMDNARTR